MRLLLCSLAIALTFTSAAQAATAPPADQAAAPKSRTVTRAYLLTGLVGGGDAMNAMAAQLRAHGVLVTISSYTEADAIAADACAHRGDRLIIMGHSLGATASASIATKAAACGARNVTMVGIDPPNFGATVSGVSHAVNFVGELNGKIAGAQNIMVPGYGHWQIVDDPAMQRRFLAAALGH